MTGSTPTDSEAQKRGKIENTAQTLQNVENMVVAISEGVSERLRYRWQGDKKKYFLDGEVAKAVRGKATERQPRPLTITHLSEAEEGIYFELSRVARYCLVQL